MHFWYAHVEGSPRGPMSADDLLSLAAQTPEPAKLPVWREGFSAWQTVGDVEELRARLSPYAAPRQPAALPAERAEQVARLFRRLVLLVGVWVVFSMLQPPLEGLAEEAAGSGVATILLVAVILVLLVAIAVTTFRLTGALGEESPLLWAILMFLPCANLIGLILVSYKAQTWCRRHGLAVGLLGPKRESIEALRRRAAAESPPTDG